MVAISKEKNRKARDLFIDKVLAPVNLPISHFPCKRNYNKELLTQRIEEKLIN
jgi:hypothetical protein